MTGMSTDEAYALYKNDATAGVHPDDLDYIIGRLNQHLKKHLDTWKVSTGCAKKTAVISGSKTILHSF